MTLQGVGVVMPLFAGVDQAANPPQPQIHFYDPLGAQFHAVNHAASGSGSATIRSILNFQERYGQPHPASMPLAEAVRFALRLLMTAAELDAATGGVDPAGKSFATVRLLRGTGIEVISEAQQARWLAQGA